MIIVVYKACSLMSGGVGIQRSLWGVNHNLHCDIDLINYKHLNLSIIIVCFD